MTLTIFNNESAQEVMDRLKFVLMEFGVSFCVDDYDEESVTYNFYPVPLLDEEET